MKVAASPRIYMGRCPKVVFSHQSLVTSNPQSLATHPLKYREKLDTYGSWQNAFFSCKIVVKYYSVVIIGKL